MAVSASSPMVVLVGGIVTMYAATGAVGVPASFLVLAVALAPGGRLARRAYDLPATFVVFDYLQDPTGVELLSRPLRERRGRFFDLFAELAGAGNPVRAGHAACSYS
jgi:ATP-dependent DNA ligase